MSEQNTSNPKTIVTGTKEKDPRRVAAGKRLGARSKQYKEEKALRLSQQSDDHISESNNKTLYFVGGLLVVGAASYLLFANKKKVVRTLTGDKEESDPAPEQKPTPKKENFKSVFDD